MRGMLATVFLLIASAVPAWADHGGPGGWQPVRDAMAGVPCRVDSVGEETTANLKLLKQMPYPDATLHHERGELDIRGHLALVARFSPARGFDIIDISDPLNPVVAGRTPTGGANRVVAGLDVKFSPSGELALVGADNGIVVVDIRNVAAPVKRLEWSFPGGAASGPLRNGHMLYTKRINGTDWVFLAPNGTLGVWIFKLEGTADAPTLTMVSQSLPVEGGPLGPHDMWVTYDDDEAKWLLYVADAFHGWLAFDISNPALPIPWGGFVHPSAGYTHTIQAAKIGSRRIVATIEEVGVNFLKVYDATVLQAPVLLGVWQAHTGTGSADAQHNFQIVGGKLYMAYDGHGIYILDLTTLGLPFVSPIGPMAHFAGSGVSGPLVFNDNWDVVLAQGVLYSTHRYDGLQVIGFGCNEPGDPSLTSTG